MSALVREILASGSRGVARALIDGASERGEVVRMTSRQIEALRQLGAIKPERLFLTPGGIEARATLVARDRARAAK